MVGPVFILWADIYLYDHSTKWSKVEIPSVVTCFIFVSEHYQASGIFNLHLGTGKTMLRQCWLLYRYIVTDRKLPRGSLSLSLTPPPTGQYLSTLCHYYINYPLIRAPQTTVIKSFCPNSKDPHLYCAGQQGLFYAPFIDHYHGFDKPF